ncbi:hypothetical protein Q5H93_09310 [Hymenobacter sp. ASUV-10]|uniref:DUF3885 domain-containing protein n=1 Tax=Hymenobacter aranciens TaxID=3063996 RepID=A0ABT9BBB4_9BACT|nr:hypothetical protein [Hymenobacter sp. ASUV-10]MDO7874928.1 hypothetical protein [Hymenobacter sp. ASUV-10]
MTAEQFSTFWATTYPATLPLGHNLKKAYRDRWFRIHSLPESKKYASTQAEWQVLLDRQNGIITDLLGESGPILLVTGEYRHEGIPFESALEETALANYSFVTVADVFDLHQSSPAHYDAGDFYQVSFSEQRWQSGKFNEMLRAIANDEMRAFFVSIVNNCIVAPYDGGIDFILHDTATRNHYREKYAAWLSSHPEGF